MASLSAYGVTHPPRSNPPLRSSSGPPSPCITPSTVTIVRVVSFMVEVPFSFGRCSVPRRSDRRPASGLPLLRSWRRSSGVGQAITDVDDAAGEAALVQEFQGHSHAFG